MLPVSNTVNTAKTHHAAVKHESLTLEVSTGDKGDPAQFHAALERHLAAIANNGMPGAGAPGKASLGDKILKRCTSIAGAVKDDQAYVSRMLEQATRTGDSMEMMKAMMALSDYQTRVQFVSKTVSKATSSLDQLTRLQ